MPFKRPTWSEIDKRIYLDIATRLSGPVKDATQWMRTALLRQEKTVVGVLARAYAGACHHLYGFLAWLATQRFVHSMEDEFLVAEGMDYGIPPKTADYARGKAAITGNEGAILAAKVVCQREDGVQYQVVDPYPIVDGTAVVGLKAVVAGQSGNAPIDTKLTLINPPANISTQLVVVGNGLTGGVDDEPADEYRARILTRKRQPPQGGAAHDYVAWAKEVPGVTRAWCLPLWLGLGTVGVMFMRDHDENPFPNEDQRLVVWKHIEPLRPVTASEICVISPKRLGVDITVRISPDDKSVRAAVIAEAEDFILREGEPNGVLRVSRLSEAISAAVGEHHHHLILPINDVSIPEDAIPALGNVVFVNGTGGGS